MKHSLGVMLVLCTFHLVPEFCRSQDSIKVFSFPKSDQIDVSIVVHASKVGQTFRFEYEIRSLITSKQVVWTFDIPIDASPANIRSPQGWTADAGMGVPRITWWSRDSSYNIHPNKGLSGFGYDSEGVPSIRTMYLSGWVDPPELTFEPDSTVGEDILEASKRVLTVAASKPPSPFVPTIFIDTLVSYKHQAADLGWIINKGVINSLDQKLENAKKHLVQGNNKAARNVLEAFVSEVEALNKKGKQLTSEAYALLKFNAEYLISKL